MESLIKIGNNTKINNNFIAISNRAGIEIGENCVIGYSVEILDSDFHGFYGKEKGESHLISKKVIIWNNVFIGSNVKILKGSRIGDNSIIGINPVVRGKVSDNVVYAGNPGQIIIHL
jgi:maltose O-acetyltransferase